MPGARKLPLLLLLLPLPGISHDIDSEVYLAAEIKRAQRREQFRVAGLLESNLEADAAALEADAAALAAAQQSEHILGDIGSQLQAEGWSGEAAVVVMALEAGQMQQLQQQDLDREEVMDMPVWSRGIAKLCDFEGWHSSVGEDGHAEEHFDRDLYEGIQDGHIVYVQSGHVRKFMQDILPTTKGKFVLVTGDDDYGVPNGALQGVYGNTSEASNLRQLLGAPQLLHWFTQNLDLHAPHPKMSAIPIGIDFHTLSPKDKASPYWAQQLTTPQTQAAQLLEARQASPTFSERYAKAYCNFQFTTSQERRNALADLENDATEWEKDPLPRDETWERMTQYAFVISPPGHGQDCHRTWEALLLGCVPIVLSSPLDSLFEHLPVKVVQSYKEVTAGAMQQWQTEMESHWGPKVEQMLNNKYWLQQFQDAVKDAGLERAPKIAQKRINSKHQTKHPTEHTNYQKGQNLNEEPWQQLSSNAFPAQDSQQAVQDPQSYPVDTLPTFFQRVLAAKKKKRDQTALQTPT